MEPAGDDGREEEKRAKERRGEERQGRWIDLLREGSRSKSRYVTWPARRLMKKTLRTVRQ